MKTLLLLIGLLAKLAPLLASLLGGSPNRKTGSAKGQTKPETIPAFDGLLRAVRSKWQWQKEEKDHVGEVLCNTHLPYDAERLRESDGYRRD